MYTASIMNLNTEVKRKYKCLNNNDWRFVSKTFYDREIILLENAKNEKKRPTCRKQHKLRFKLET